jgi:hypothetical protein
MVSTEETVAQAHRRLSHWEKEMPPNLGFLILFIFELLDKRDGSAEAWEPLLHANSLSFENNRISRPSDKKKAPQDSLGAWWETGLLHRHLP